MTTDEIAVALQALVDDAAARGFKEPGARHSQRSPCGLATHTFSLEWGRRGENYEVGFGATPDEAFGKLRDQMARIDDPAAKEIAALYALADAHGYMLTACADQADAAA